MCLHGQTQRFHAIAIASTRAHTRVCAAESAHPAAPGRAPAARTRSSAPAAPPLKPPPPAPRRGTPRAAADKNAHRADEAHERFQEIANAYEVLSDKHERAW